MPVERTMMKRLQMSSNPKHNREVNVRCVPYVMEVENVISVIAKGIAIIATVRAMILLRQRRCVFIVGLQALVIAENVAVITNVNIATARDIKIDRL
jgi:hypothetical protein